MKCGWRVGRRGTGGALVVLSVLLFGAAFGGRASAVNVNTVLPPYTDTADGVPVAFWFDNFVSYSGDLLYQFQQAGLTTSSGFNLATAGTYDPKGAGVGRLPLLIYTGATGANNDFTSSGLGVFENPIQAPSGSTSDHLTTNNYWGLDDRDPTSTVANSPYRVVGDTVTPDDSELLYGKNNVSTGIVTIGDVLNYLHAFDPRNNIPVFGFNDNQTGSSADLFVAGQVFILNPTTHAIVAEWTIENFQPGPVPGYAVPNPNGTNEPFETPTLPASFDSTNPFNNTPWVPVPSTESFTGTSGTTYTATNNLGGGKNDFLAYAPSMDLSKYDPADYIFGGQFFLGDDNDGYDEAFVAGSVEPYIIPEPGTIYLGLLGLAACGLVLLRRRRLARA
jgi:PEP-CTERM motif